MPRKPSAPTTELFSEISEHCPAVFRYDLRLDRLRAHVKLLTIGFQSSLQALEFGALRLCVDFELPELCHFRCIRHDSALMSARLFSIVLATLHDAGFLIETVDDLSDLVLDLQLQARRSVFIWRMRGCPGSNVVDCSEICLSMRTRCCRESE